MHRFLILIVLFASGCGSSSKNENAKTELTASTPEEFAQSVVTLLAANDPNKFIEFVYPTKEELLAFAMTIVPADEMGKVTEEIERDFASNKKEVLESFAKVRNELAGDGCDWNQVQSVRAEYEIRERKGISKARIEVTFSTGSQTHEFRLACMLVNDRWCTMDSIAEKPVPNNREVNHGHGHAEEANHGHGPDEAEMKNSSRQPRVEQVAQNQKLKKLSAEEVASLLAEEIGRWKITGKMMPVGGDPEPFEDTMETRWKVKGKSIAVTFSPLINGERVPFTGHKEYDPQEGVFIWRSKGEGLPETVSREQYDPATRTYRGKSTYPDGAKETTTFKRVSKNKNLWTSQVEVDGKVVFSREAVFTRLPDSGDEKKK